MICELEWCSSSSEQYGVNRAVKLLTLQNGKVKAIFLEDKVATFG